MNLQYGLPANLMNWVERNHDKLSPPVCNAAVFPDGDYIINMVGGPNYRTDFHCNPTEEIFYQIKGNAHLNIWDRGKFEQILIKEGDIFLLPVNLLHSPQRPEPGLCLLIEKPRPEGNPDALNWYCANCATLIFSASGQLTNLVENLPAWYQLFYQKTDAERTCPSCGEVHAGKDALTWLARFKDVHQMKYG